MSPARGSAFHCLRSSFIYQCRTLALGDSPASRCCGRNGNVDLWQRICVARGRRALARRLRMASFFGVSICRTCLIWCWYGRERTLYTKCFRHQEFFTSRNIPPSNSLRPSRQTERPISWRSYIGGDFSVTAHARIISTFICSSIDESHPHFEIGINL